MKHLVQVRAGLDDGDGFEDFFSKNLERENGESVEDFILRCTDEYQNLLELLYMGASDE